MPDETTQAYREAEDAAREGLPELLQRVADRIGLHAGAQAVFGEAVQRDAVTVIPVAQMIIGTGAGQGTAGDDVGSGAGGGALTRPLGCIEIGDEGAIFRPIRQPWQNATLVVSLAFATLLLAKAVRTLLRG